MSINFVSLTLNIFKSFAARFSAISVLVVLLMSGFGPPVAKIRDWTQPFVSGFSSALSLRSAVLTKSFKVGCSSLLTTFLITFSTASELNLILGISVSYLATSSFSLVNKSLRGFKTNLETSPRIVPVLGFSFTLPLDINFSSAIKSC